MGGWKIKQMVRKLPPFRSERKKGKMEKYWGAYHLANGNFGCESNGTVIFRKIRSEIVDYLQRSSFPVRNGTAEISLPFAKFSSFQSFISRKQLQEIEL